MANQLIFSGRPSQIINLPACLKGLVVIALIGAIHVLAASTYPFQWRSALAQMIAVVLGVGLPFLKTARTRIVIDTERITWRQGILRRRASFLPLSQIQGITLVYPWWQRLFGTGMLVVATTDARHPVRHLPGIRDAELLCREIKRAASASRDFKDDPELGLNPA
jgi:uncharacterized membrane protein YdbT with pleckstrin-like domain